MNNIIMIDKTEVDIEALYSITYCCTPGICTKSQCCCSKYEICIDRKEMSNLIGFLPEASTYAEYLNDGDGYENVFDEREADLLAIDMNDEDICAFSYLTKKEEILCSLHTAALELNLPPHEVKPKSCTTWPLAVSDTKPVRLSISDDAFKKGAIPPPPNMERLDPSLTAQGHQQAHKSMSALLQSLHGRKAALSSSPLRRRNVRSTLAGPLRPKSRPDRLLPKGARL